MSPQRPYRFVCAGLVLVLAIALPALAQDAKAPSLDGSKVVASVNGEPITLEELLAQVAAFHADVSEPHDGVSRPDASALLERMINARLILQEARSIGLQDLPDVREQIDVMREGIIKGTLVRREVSADVQADPNVAENIYREAMREWRIDSVLFGSEDEAIAFAGLVNKGSEFEKLAAREVASGKARGGQDSQWVKASEVRPEVKAALGSLEPGAITPPVRLSDGFAIVKVYDIRYPEDPQARRNAEATALEVARQEKLREYMNELRKEYTQIDQKLFDSLDYEAEQPGLEKLRADERVVATIKGGEPIRVKDLTEAVEKKFFHGMEGAVERKRVNQALPGVLDRLLLKRATMLEAERLGIEKTPEFEESLRVQEEGILFAKFVTKVINPDVNLSEGEIKKEYDAHIQDYTSPPMIRLEGLAFDRREDAEAALEKLRKGADFKWVKANEPGQADPERYDGYLDFRGSLIIVSALPQEVQDAVEGASSGQFRFYAPTGGPTYVLHVREVLAPRQRPYEAAREEIAQKLVSGKRQAALEQYAAKLRAASEVEILATRAELDDLLGLRFAGGSR